MCDGKEETCWNSDQVKTFYLHFKINIIYKISNLKQGPTQWIIINFKDIVNIKRIEIKFQGGFCSSQARLEVIDESDSNKKRFKNIFQFFPQDNNSSQVKNIYTSM